MTSTAKQNPGCLTALLRLFGPRPSEATGHLPYRARDDFLSQAEISFYRVLLSVLSTQGTICPKVRLSDVFYVSRPNENRTFFNRIVQKHVDFLVCNPISMKPIFALELDDSTHTRSDRQVRDEFVDSVFQAAGLPLLHIRAQRQYSIQEVRTQIAPFVNSTGVG